MNTYLRAKLTSMTLVVAAKNKECIVVGADTLSMRYDDDGVSNPEIQHVQKMHQLGNNGAILVAGHFLDLGVIDQFIRDLNYTFNRDNIHSATSMAFEVSNRAKNTMVMPLDSSSLEIIIVGFDENEPILYYMESNPNNGEAYRLGEAIGSYLVGGLKHFGQDMAIKHGMSEELSNKELRKKVRAIIEDGKSEYPKDVGGKVFIHSLYP